MTVDQQIISVTPLNRKFTVLLVVVAMLALVPSVVFLVIDFEPTMLITIAVVALVMLWVLTLKTELSVSERGIRGRTLLAMTGEVPWSEVVDVVVGEETGLLTGAGYRIGPKGRYVVSGGPSITVKSRATDLHISTPEPEAAVASIRRIAADRGWWTPGQATGAASRVAQ